MLIPVLAFAMVGLWGFWYAWRARRALWLFWALMSLGLAVLGGLFLLEVRLPVLGRLQLWRFGDFWPTLIWVLAMAYFLTFVLTGWRRGRMLLASLGFAMLGAVAFAFSLQFLSVAQLQSGQLMWPSLVIIAGIGLIGPFLSALLRRRQTKS